jgi:hypothetical protein
MSKSCAANETAIYGQPRSTAAARTTKLPGTDDRALPLLGFSPGRERNRIQAPTK